MMLNMVRLFAVLDGCKIAYKDPKTHMMHSQGCQTHNGHEVCAKDENYVGCTYPLIINENIENQCSC